MSNKLSVPGLLLVLSFALPGYGQGRPAAEDRPSAGTDRSGGISSSSGGDVTSRGISTGSFSTSGSTYGRSDTGIPSGFSTSAAPSSTGGYSTPNLTGTSWASSNYYYDWQNFLWSLQRHYMLDRMYFNRFYRNTEPLVTPHLLRLALREPLTLSARMLRSLDELETLVAQLQAGDASRKEEIAIRTREIRDLAKKIRQDPSLTYVDKRGEKDAIKDSSFDRLGLDAIRQLREVITDLHTQMNGMFNQTTTSTISVQSLTQPSFESLSKSIEKLSKVIDAAVKRS